MKHKVAKDLEGLLVPIDQLKQLEHNPRRGNLAAIKASYDKFGQAKPLVGVRDGDKIVIIAGNHQLRAAKELGWTHVAVSVADYNDKQAIAFALADNRTSELGDIDTGVLYEAMQDIVEDYGDMLEDLGWDEFEIATLESDYLDSLEETETFETGFTPPELVRPIGGGTGPEKEEEEDEIRFVGTEEESKTIATQGATTVGAQGAKSVVQYTLVFESAADQQEWYAFIRWLKSNRESEGETTSEKLLWFIRTHKR